MIAYQMVGTSNLDKAKLFYDQIFSVLGAPEATGTEKAFFYTFTSGGRFAVTLPHNGELASVGNGSMTAFACESPEQVFEMHAIALKAGGVDEGAPGDRQGYGTFAYFRDLDGNKLCASFFNR